MASAGRHRVVTHIAPGAEKDPDFQRVQKELEEAQQRQGFLFGSGAFDRTDIAYLKDLKEEVRVKEDELDHQASSEYARLRSKASAELDAALPQPGVVMLATKQKKEAKPIHKLLPIRISPAGPKPQQPAGLTLTSPRYTQITSLPAKRDRPAAVGGAAEEGKGAKQGKTGQEEQQRQQDQAGPSGNGEGLAGLLGYDDDEEEDEGKEGGQGGAGPAGPGGAAEKAGAAAAGPPTAGLVEEA